MHPSPTCAKSRKVASSAVKRSLSCSSGPYSRPMRDVKSICLNWWRDPVYDKGPVSWDLPSSLTCSLNVEYLWEISSRVVTVVEDMLGYDTLECSRWKCALLTSLKETVVTIHSWSSSGVHYSRAIPQLKRCACTPQASPTHPRRGKARL